MAARAGPAVFRALACGDDAVEVELCELSCIVADPGAPRQPLHADTSISDKELVTIFVPLQDTTEKMGPTQLLMATHNRPDLHAECAADALGAGAGLLGDPTRRLVQFAGAAGDAMLMNSRLLHCGGKNRSKRRRRLLYLSFFVPPGMPPGSTASLLAEYSGRLRLDQFGILRNTA